MIAAPTNQTTIATTTLFPNGGNQPPHPSQPAFPPSTDLVSMLVPKPAPTSVIPTVRAVTDCPPLEHANTNSSGGTSPIPNTYPILPQTTKLEEEPNPFEQSFSTDITKEAAVANSNNMTRPILPPLAAIDSPTIRGSLFRKDELVWDSLRAGPLSPSMLTGPATVDRRHHPHPHHLTHGGGQPQQRSSSNLANEVVATTPCNDSSPVVDRAQRASLSNQGASVHSPVSVVHERSPSSSVKHRHSSPTAENIYQEPPTFKRRVQTTPPSAYASLDVTGGEVDEEKRKNFLERNRRAAFKCRQRKKQWVQNLQAKVEYLTAANDELHKQAAGLREQLIQLRMLVLEHKSCPVDPHALMEAVNRPIPEIIPRTAAAQLDPAEVNRYSFF